MDEEVFYVPENLKDRRVCVTLSTPVALAKMPDGNHVPVTVGLVGTLMDIKPTSIVVATETGTFLGMQGEYAIKKKDLLAVGAVSKIERALVMPSN